MSVGVFEICCTTEKVDFQISKILRTLFAYTSYEGSAATVLLVVEGKLVRS